MPKLQGLTVGQCLSPTPSVLGGRVLDCLFSNIWKALRNSFPQQTHTLQYFCYMMAKHQTFEMSTKDHYALCPRVSLYRHAQPHTVYSFTMCRSQTRRSGSPFYICVGTCTSLWFPERLLGSQSPISPLNAAGPDRRQEWEASTQMASHKIWK